ncbi:MAG TPA: TRAP transporter small permease [Burkholderiales bacterium]|nr:TRAP transporter small permease [Burkholderiales bacterium]
MRQAAAAISAFLIAAVLGAVLVGVARRYVFSAPLSWTDELAAVLFVWSVFWAAAFAVPLREHVAFDLLFESLPPGARRVLGIVASAVVGLALLAALPKTVEFVGFLWRERTPALQWRLDYVYACFPLFMGAAALRFLSQALRLCLRRS